MLGKPLKWKNGNKKAASLLETSWGCSQPKPRSLTMVFVLKTADTFNKITVDKFTHKVLPKPASDWLGRYKVKRLNFKELKRHAHRKKGCTCRNCRQNLISCSVKLTEKTINKKLYLLIFDRFFKSSSVNWKIGDQTNAEPV